ncbi:NAD(P)-binding domain-containing protein [Mumia sp. zg.B53]|uniref:flavin-containing monooxygenase n=1 Tax=Mumia sp. zg.B53 TaxID=2855449 RepID=UPI001C6E260F|nr:NAD(P)-binding domain-containing protein [Mumia sp. zg.B53]MBW9216287.1 NAD(P)-binding domain-containing protein [Mumia sp. zg.B53]
MSKITSGGDAPPALPYAVIGAGPSGLAATRALTKRGLDVVGYELHDDVGGLWDIDGPRSTMYESAHLISSKTTTQFAEMPMGDEAADYPSHRELKRYFRAYADRFGLRDHYRFGTEVTRVEPHADGGWVVTTREVSSGSTSTDRVSGVVIANGTLSEPNLPQLKGQFDGEVFHTSAYKKATTFAGKRVLIIGAGNSGCDIAVDAVHHAASVDMSVRRGYYFVPKYLFGKPADTLNQGKPLPPRVKQAIDTRVLKLFTGDPVKLGFPKPDYKIYESHPIVNSLILHHLGHGDLSIKPDVDHVDGSTVHFRDGTSRDYDTIVLATGYTLHYPFIDPALLRWNGWSPQLYLNIFTPERDDLFVMGMVEASGLGWQGRYEQAELIASYVDARRTRPAQAEAFAAKTRGPLPDLSGGYRYLGLERMSYYVNKDAYRTAVRAAIEELS